MRTPNASVSRPVNMGTVSTGSEEWPLVTWSHLLDAWRHVHQLGRAVW
jgi:hypothetical protein